MPTTFTAGGDTDILQQTLSAYSDEAYKNARKLSGTGIVGGNPLIDTETETFIGQLRWMKPLNPTVNVASLTNAADGTKTNYDTDFLSYIKTVRTHGADKINMKQVVTQHDGLAKIGRDFGETQAQDEHDAIMAVLKGVTISEVLRGNAGAGGQTFDNDPASATHGFYVDMGANPVVAAPAAGMIGAVRATAILEAFGKAYKDYEPAYAYLICSPEVMSSFRSANLVDSSKVTDGNVDFETIFNGKFRLVQTRANQGLTAAEILKLNTKADGTNITVGAKTTYIVLPGAMAMEALAVPDPTEITRDGNKYNGGGITTIWRRWGYVLAPAGYDWVGKTDAFPTNAHYSGVMVGGNSVALTAAADVLAGVTASWNRKGANVLSLGVLPVFHS